MSRQSDRIKQQLNYKVLHSEGKKVAKENRDLQKITKDFENLSKMALANLVNDEKKTSRKFTRFLDEYSDLSDLFDITDIERAIIERKGLIDQFEEDHVELEKELGEKYEEQYPNFNISLKSMMDWVKKAKTEIKNRKVEKKTAEQEKENREEVLRKEREEKEKEARVKEVEKEESLRREREMKEEQVKEVEKADQLRKEIELETEAKNKKKEKLRKAEKHMAKRIDMSLKSIQVENSMFIEDMERNISHIRDLLKEHSDLFVQIEHVFGDDYEKEFSLIFDGQNTHLYECLCKLIKLCQRTKLAELKNKEMIEQARIVKEKEVKFQENTEKIEVFEIIYSNVKERVLILKSKCSFNVNEMSDSDLLQKYKDFTVIDRDFGEILDRVTELAKASPPMYDKAVEMLARARNAQANLKTLKISYQDKVLREIKIRDLTQEKRFDFGHRTPEIQGI